MSYHRLVRDDAKCEAALRGVNEMDFRIVQRKCLGYARHPWQAVGRSPRCKRMIAARRRAFDAYLRYCE